MSNPLVLVMSEGMIRNNWTAIYADRDNGRKDLETPDAFIEEIKAGKLVILGATVILSEPIPILCQI